MGITLSPWMMAFLVLMTGFAGFVDSAAGGGGLISLPAYLFAGLPPHYTYATNKFSAACGTTFATANFFKNGAMNLKVGILAAIGSFAGSALGAHIVLLLSDELLRTMMFLILPVAAVVILWQRDLPDQNRDDGTLNLKKILLALGIGLGIGLYDGIVGPGTGTFAIIAFTTLMGFDLRTANGNGKVLNLASNYASLFTYLMNGLVVFHIGIPCAVSNILGNLLGSHFALKKGARFIRSMMLVVLVLLLGKLISDAVLWAQGGTVRNCFFTGRLPLRGSLLLPDGQQSKTSPFRGRWHRAAMTERVHPPQQKTSRAARRLPDFGRMIFFRWPLIPAPALYQRTPDRTRRGPRGCQ